MLQASVQTDEGRAEQLDLSVSIRRSRQQRVWRALASAVLLALLVLAVGSAAALAQEPSPAFDLNNVPVPEQPPAAVLGEGIYQQSCAPCHGATGGGDGPATADMPNQPTAFADPAWVWERSPAELFHTTKFGRIEQMMPPWQNQLGDDEIWQAVYYAWDLHTSEAEVAEGAAIYAEQCTACHGDGGAGDGPESTGDLTDFSDLSAMRATSQAALMQGWVEAHPEIGEGLNDAQQKAVLAYIRTFTYTPAWESPLGSGPGTIQGDVAQQTPGGEPFSGGTIALEVYAHMTPLDTLETTVGPDGRFSFTDLPVDPSLFYLVATEYKGIRYSTPVLRFGEEGGAQDDPESAQTLEATLPIFETTNDPAGLTISRASWIVEHEPGALLIGQVLSFGNSGDRTFTGRTVAGVDVPVTLEIPLPAGAQSVGFQDGVLGETYRQVGDTVYDTRPVPPGSATRQTFVRFRLPYDGKTTTVEQPLVYPVEGLNLLVADLPELDVSATAAQGELTANGEQEVQGLVYLQWAASALAPQTLTLQLSGLLAAGDQDPRVPVQTGSVAGAAAGAAAAATPPLDPVAPFVLGGALFLLLAGVLIWRWRWGAAQTTMDEPDVEERRDDLIRRIAHLDDLRALGEVDDEDWQRQRAILKRELFAVAAQAGDGARE